MMPTPEIPLEADSVRLPFEVSSVTTARHLVSDALTELGAERCVIDDANIVVGELVMNAVRHGRPHGDGTVEVTWAVVADVLRFSVSDGGRVEHLAATMPSATSFGGRGLAMVDLLCRDWGYDGADGTRVVADIPAPTADR
jgi:anti-sigma regulatory factor (Ser/Thr protein kinase)